MARDNEYNSDGVTESKTRSNKVGQIQQPSYSTDSSNCIKSRDSNGADHSFNHSTGNNCKPSPSLSGESTNPATDSEMESEESVDVFRDKTEPTNISQKCNGTVQENENLIPPKRKRGRPPLKRVSSNNISNQFTDLFKSEKDFLVWKNNIGYLPGSNWKFRYNDYGLLELIEENKKPKKSSKEGSSDVCSSRQSYSDDQNNSEPPQDSINNNQQEDSSCNPPQMEDEEDEDDQDDDEEDPVSNICMTRSRNRSVSNNDLSTSMYGRRRKHRVIDGEVVGLMGRKERLAELVHTKVFEWDSYLQEVNGKAAPESCFPHIQNLNQGKSRTACFKRGDKLEGIDPHHESLFCVLTVAEVQGHRIRLHFDGYSERFDFWTNINSPFIFPAGWCEHNNKKLMPPKGMSNKEFCWSSYLNKHNAQTAHRSLFTTPWDLPERNYSFEVGMKLEAVDKRNPQMTCVATVQDFLMDFILIHFDDWDTGFDQWVHANSPFLRPVGFCEDKEKILSLPSTWIDRLSSFSWENYLKESNSEPVPLNAFKTRGSIGLEVGMYLEFVDRRCPQLIRVACVASTTGLQNGTVTIRYEGWPDKFNVEVEEDSPDLYPVGYCARWKHPLQPPPSLHDHLMNEAGSMCPTPGCRGIGHVKGPKYTTHNRASGCPYSDHNIKKDFRLYERFQEAGSQMSLGDKKQMISKSALAKNSACLLSKTTQENDPEPLELKIENSDSQDYSNSNEAVNGTNHNFVMPDPQQRRKRGRPRKDEMIQRSLSNQSLSPTSGLNKVEKEKAFKKQTSVKTDYLQSHQSNSRPFQDSVENICSPQPPASLVHSPSASALRSVFNPVGTCGEHCRGTTYWPGIEEKRLVQSNVLWKLVPQASELCSPNKLESSEMVDDLGKWTPEKVAKFVAKIPGCQSVASAFIENEIDGQALFYLEQYDLMRILHLRLGPAVKLASAILGLRYKYKPPALSSTSTSLVTSRDPDGQS